MADIPNSAWSETDASNTTAPPNGWPEGQMPSTVNDCARMMMGATKRWYDWSIPAVTAGTSTAYTLTYTVAPGALVDGMTFMVQFNAQNGDQPTLNVNALGAKQIQYLSGGAWRNLPAAMFDANWIWPCTYSASDNTFRLRGFNNRTGEGADFYGSTAPAGTLLCAGQAVSRADYAGLFSVIGTTYGVGDGSTTFNLPDARGRVGAGKDNMGGSAASRLTSTTMSPDGNTLGATGGAQTQTAATNSTGSTSGSMTLSATGVVAAAGLSNVATSGASSATEVGDAVTVTGTATGSLTVSASGTSGAFGVVQPTIIVNKVIRF